MKTNKTFYSGFAVITIMLLAVLAFVFWHITDAYRAIAAEPIYGVLVGALMLWGYLALLFFWGKGTYSLTVTDGSIITRVVFSQNIIPVSAIRAMRYQLIITGTGKHRKVQELLKIAYSEREEKEAIVTVPIRYFSQKTRKEFFSALFADHPAITIHTSLRDYVRTLGLAVGNPTVEEFPVGRERSPDILKSLGLRPDFSETTLFLMLVSLIALTILDPYGVLADFLAILDVASSARKGGNIVLFLAVMAIGAVVSLYQLLRKGKKSKFSMYTMAVFGIGMSAIAGIFSGIHIIEHDLKWPTMILSLYNIFYGFGIFFSANNEEEDGYMRRVRNRDAKWHEVAIGLVVVAGIIAVGTYHFHSNWVFIFSACVAYAAALNARVEKLFPHFHKNRAEVGFELNVIDSFFEKILTWMSNNRIKTFILFLALIYGSLFGLGKILRSTDALDTRVIINYETLAHVHIAKHFDLKKPSIRVDFKYDVDGTIVDINIVDIAHFKDEVAKVIVSKARITFDTLEPAEIELAYRALDERWLGSFRSILFLFLTDYKEGKVPSYYEVRNRSAFLAERADRGDADYWRVMFDLYDHLESQNNN